MDAREEKSQKGWLVEIGHATVYRAGRCVFQDLSLTVPLGCHTAILGPNGSGKTTLLKLFSRELYPVDHPSTFVRLLGEESWNVWKLRSRLGIVSPELQSDYPGDVRGMDIVLSGYFASFDLYDHHRVSLFQREKSYQTMKTLGVDHLYERTFREMSIGEQRRVLVARAMVHDPQVLVLDEPTTGLDVQGCFRFWDCLREYLGQGNTVLLVTHHLHEIPPEIGRVVLLKNGKVVGEGPKEHLLTGDRLSSLFGIPIHVVESQGWYQTFPDEKSRYRV